jgi:hypothetical protein
MCDLVKDETERIDSRFLEPACGDGNFLAEILTRKLEIVKRKYKKSSLDYEKNAVLAASSIYGVDILIDNVIACRERMFKIWDKEYKSVCKKDCNDMTRDAVRFILKRNIVCGLLGIKHFSFHIVVNFSKLHTGVHSSVRVIHIEISTLSFYILFVFLDKRIKSDYFAF